MKILECDSKSWEVNTSAPNQCFSGCNLVWLILGYRPKIPTPTQAESVFSVCSLQSKLWIVSTAPCLVCSPSCGALPKPRALHFPGQQKLPLQRESCSTCGRRPEHIPGLGKAPEMTKLMSCTWKGEWVFFHRIMSKEGRMGWGCSSGILFWTWENAE